MDAIQNLQTILVGLVSDATNVSLPLLTQCTELIRDANAVDRASLLRSILHEQVPFVNRIKRIIGGYLQAEEPMEEAPEELVQSLAFFCVLSEVAAETADNEALRGSLCPALREVFWNDMTPQAIRVQVMESVRRMIAFNPRLEAEYFGDWEQSLAAFA